MISSEFQKIKLKTNTSESCFPVVNFQSGFVVLNSDPFRLLEMLVWSGPVFLFPVSKIQEVLVRFG